MDKHISTQFDNELTGVSTRILELGGLVESQTRHAVYALAQFSSEVADQVIATEKQVNLLEVEIDGELASIIARRQPTARDLRLLMAISKITGNLERAGDEAERIARMVKQILNMAVTILKEDDLIDAEFNGFVRKLITYMMEDPRTISASLDLLFVAKAIERIGDHAKNIAEFVIYVVKGADVRHTALTEIEKAVQ